MEQALVQFRQYIVGLWQRQLFADAISSHPASIRAGDKTQFLFKSLIPFVQIQFN